MGKFDCEWLKYKLAKRSKQAIRRTKKLHRHQQDKVEKESEGLVQAREKK